MSGEWKFKWMAETKNFRFRKFDDSSWDKIDIPGFWNEKTGTGNGFGWFRLNIVLDEKRDLGMLINERVYTAYTLYVNGRKLLQNGKAGVNIKTTIPQMRPGFTPINPTRKFTISWKISNGKIKNP